MPAREAELEGDSYPYHGEDRRTHESERRTHEPGGIEPVVLTRKLADMIDGVSLAGHRVGDRLPVSSRDAGLLIAEGWASPSPVEQRRPTSGNAEEVTDRRHYRG
jgi:hypothetical protein